MKAKPLLFTCLMAAFALLSCDKKADAVEFNFNEPVLSWGASPATIKAQETRTLTKTEGTTLIYSDSNKFVFFYIYMFDESDHLESATILLNNNITLNQAKEYIETRYPYIGLNGDKPIYGNSTTIVSFANSELGVLILYAPAP